MVNYTEIICLRKNIWTIFGNICCNNRILLAYPVKLLGDRRLKVDGLLRSGVDKLQHAGMQTQTVGR